MLFVGFSRTFEQEESAGPSTTPAVFEVQKASASQINSTFESLSTRLTRIVEGGVGQRESRIHFARSSATSISVARSAPIHLSIPALGISVRVSKVGLNSSGAVNVPSSFGIPAWYDQGYSPGQVGSAAILGHVDSTSGPGVFYHLVDMKPGQRVKVILANHRTLVFVVIGIRQYSKNGFPDQLVYGPKSYSALNLVTCGGVFDSATHHYLSNIVVFTKLA
jgi:hypothetical protein